MNDFFKIIYDNALSSRALDHEDNPEYRRARDHLEHVTAGLCHDENTQDRLMDAVYELLYHSDIFTLAFGFRLAVQVIGPAAPACLRRA